MKKKAKKKSAPKKAKKPAKKAAKKSAKSKTKSKPKKAKKAKAKTKAPAAKKSPILHTSGGEMPDVNAGRFGQTREDVQAAFGRPAAVVGNGSAMPDRLPESSGDLADQAEAEIETDIQEKIDRIRGR